MKKSKRKNIDKETNHNSPFLPTASLKNFGDKTANLFSKKKDEAEKLANDKAVEAQKLAEEQAKKVGQSVQQTKSEAEQLATSTGK